LPPKAVTAETLLVTINPLRMAARAGVELIAVPLQAAPFTLADDFAGLNGLDEELPVVANIEPCEVAEVRSGRLHVRDRDTPGASTLVSVVGDTTFAWGAFH